MLSAPQECPVQNAELLKTKISLFNQMGRETFSSELKVDFHGISLLCRTASEAMLEVLKASLPKHHGVSFVGPVTTIDWYTPEDILFFPAHFSDEPVPDCHIFESPAGEFAVQRDFVGHDNLMGRISVLTDPQNTDGVYNALRWALPRRMLQHSRILLHSSAVVNREGSAYIFLGHSGFGKTTVASLADDRLVLGDDMNVIFIDRHVTVKQAFLGGVIIPKIENVSTYPIKAIYWLKQSTSVDVIPLTTITGLQKLVASAANIFIGAQKQVHVKQVMELAMKIIEHVPCYELRFQKNKEFWNVIE